MMKKPELMAPAGSRTMLSAAVENGADAVYFGVEKLNMRAKASNFSVDELPSIVSFCRKHKVKTYLTVNSIVFNKELEDLSSLVSAAKKAGVDYIICWDPAVIEECIEQGMPYCISTQASVSNVKSALFYKKLGASRVVLARECSLRMMKEIREKADIEIEAFIHGAMCIAVSGRCFMSHHLFGKSANRGECVQPCRREFAVYDDIIDKSLVLGEDYVLSPQDLCSIEFLDKLIEAGIDSFKIEGRKRSPEYVAKTVSVYRRAIDLYYENKFTDEIKKELLEDLKTVYNRGFSSGFYFNIPSSEEYADIYGSKATTRKEYAGKVLNYYKKPKIAYALIEAGPFNLNDKILIIGPTTGVVELEIQQLMIDEDKTDKASKGDKVTFPCSKLVRPGDALYVVKEVVPEY
jgi:U32 family peptidase